MPYAEHFILSKNLCNFKIPVQTSNVHVGMFFVYRPLPFHDKELVPVRHVRVINLTVNNVALSSHTVCSQNLKKKKFKSTSKSKNKIFLICLLSDLCFDVFLLVSRRPRQT